MPELGRVYYPNYVQERKEINCQLIPYTAKEKRSIANKYHTRPRFIFLRS